MKTTSLLKLCKDFVQGSVLVNDEYYKNTEIIKNHENR